MSDSTQERTPLAVQVDAATEEFFKRTAEGRLASRWCSGCERFHWYPRALCPFCLGDTEWRDVAGRGTIYSVSVTRRAGPVPYAIAYVTLDEGFTLLTNIVDADFDRLSIGQRVTVAFRTTETGQRVPMFRPE